MLYKPILELEHICVVTFTYLTTASENCADSTSRYAIDPPVVLQAWAPADLMQTRSSHGQQMIQTHSCDWNPLCPEINTHTHTHLTALCLGLPGWAGTRKVKPIWILLKQKTVSDSDISWASLKSASRSRQITTPAAHHSVFLQAGCPSCCPTNSV